MKAGRSRTLSIEGVGLCDCLQEPRQCGEVTEDGEPDAIPVESASVRRCLHRSVASARGLRRASLPSVGAFAPADSRARVRAGRSPSAAARAVADSPWIS